MSKLSVEAKIGFFVVIGIIILGYMSMQVGEIGFRIVPGYDVRVYFDSVSGLVEGAPVEIAGVEMGSVRQISLEKGRALVILRINHNVKLAKDVRAAIRTRGILGDKYVELIHGLPSAPLIEPGGEIVYSAPPADIHTFIEATERTAENINRLTVLLVDILDEVENGVSLSLILENLKEVTETLGRIVQENEKNVAKIVVNLSDFSESLKEIGDANRDDIRNIVIGTQETLQEMEGFIATLNEITTKISEGEGSLGRLITEEETIDNLTGALASLKEIADRINRGEGTIGRLVREDDIVENIDAALVNINEHLERLDAFQIYLGYRGEYLFDRQKVKSYFTLRIQPREDKYYLLQLIDNPREDDDDFKFSAQIARRFYDLGLRGGLFESTGGVGVDYYLFDDSLTLSMEAFDFGSDQNPHLKFKADFRPFKYTYFSLGVDDFISDRGEESFFVGAGVRFLDEDIKTLLTEFPVPRF